jgi:ArsR family transcriptional regulator
METLQIYRCLCDLQRLRILNILKEGPLCVCHLIEILEADQVKVSKQLRYMKELGMLKCDRVAQWRVYRLADPDNALLQTNLQCLQDGTQESRCFSDDLKKRTRIHRRIARENPVCAEGIEQLAALNEQLPKSGRAGARPSISRH